jgi:hypothetical protein
MDDGPAICRPPAGGERSGPDYCSLKDYYKNCEIKQRGKRSMIAASRFTRRL